MAWERDEHGRYDQRFYEANGAPTARVRQIGGRELNDPSGAGPIAQDRRPPQNPYGDATPAQPTSTGAGSASPSPPPPESPAEDPPPAQPVKPEVVEVTDGFGQREPINPLGSRPPSPPPRGRSRKRLSPIAYAVLGGAGVGLLLIVAYLLFLRDDSDGDVRVDASLSAQPTSATSPARGASTTATSSVPSTTSGPATTIIPTTSAVPTTAGPRAIASSSYIFDTKYEGSSGFMLRKVPLNAATIEGPAGYCQINCAKGTSTFGTLGIALQPNTTKLQGKLLLADNMRPSTAVITVILLVDGVERSRQDITLASPWVIDLDVTGHRRVDFKTVYSGPDDFLYAGYVIFVDGLVS